MAQAEMAPGYCNVSELRWYHLRLLGTGAAHPTKELGYGMTVTRTAVGVFRITWTSNPGAFVGFTWGLGAATMSDVKGHTVTRDTFDTTNAVYTLDLSLWSASDAADELNANEYMDVVIWFKETSV